MKYLPQDKFGSGHTGYQQQVKEANIKRIFDLVRSGKCKSRAEIVRHMNLSATSVSVLVEELATRKLIDETGPAQTSLPGRRPISLRLNKSAHHLAVFSVKPEGVRFALLSLECRILEDKFFPLDCHTLDEATADDTYIELRPDDECEEVRNLQKRLYLLGFYRRYDAWTEEEGGFYDAETRQAVRDFQLAAGYSDREANGIATVELQELLFSEEAVNFAPMDMPQ